MSAFRLALWKEWREHRFALGSLGVVLPLGTWMLALQLSRGTLGDPLFHGCVALAFSVVMLIVVGGELLGAERRGPGLRWLERLPSGLAGAFRAKLVFLVLAGALAAAYGFGTGWTVARLRHAPFPAQSAELGLLVPLVLVLGVWTFAVSTWALRGGISLLAAALVLAAIGFPVWRVVAGGYEPSEREREVALALLLGGGLVAAALGFVRGARLGRGTLASAVLGLAPALVLLGATTAWSATRLAERARFDPLSPELEILEVAVAVDGRAALVLAGQRMPRWDARKLPKHVLRLDLEGGTYELLGQGHDVRMRREARAGDGGLPELDRLVVEVDAGEPLVVDPRDCARRAWDPAADRGRTWTPAGLGVRYWRRAPGERDVVLDPFRGREYPIARFADLAASGRLLVRPGRWLHSGNRMQWTWLDPDTGEREPVAWPAGSEPLVLFQDGRILLHDAEAGLRVVHPERGEARALAIEGVAADAILPDRDGLRVLARTGDFAADSRGTIVLRTRDCEAWVVLDEEVSAVTRLPVGCGFWLLRRVGDDAAIVLDSDPRARLLRLDLVTGATTTLWPPAHADRARASR